MHTLFPRLLALREEEPVWRTVADLRKGSFGGKGGGKPCKSSSQRKLLAPRRREPGFQTRGTSWKADLA